jgi:hypothetical protein
MNKPDYLKEACGHYLSSWDENKYTTGEQVVEALEDCMGDVPEGIEVWQPFELDPPDEIAEMITHLSVTYKTMFDLGVTYAKQNKEELK